MNFELKRIIVRTFWLVLKLIPHVTRSLGPSKAQGRQGKRLYGWHKRCSYLRLAKRKVRGDLSENGFLVRLRGGSGIVCTKFERKDQQTIKSNQIKSNQNNYHLQYEDKNATALCKIRFTVL